MPNSQRLSDTTRRSCLCRVWCAGVNWTIVLNVFRLQIFRRRQSSVVGNPIHTAESRHDTDTTVLSCWVLCDWVKLDRVFFVGKMLGWVVKQVGWVVLGPAI